MARAVRMAMALMLGALALTGCGKPPPQDGPGGGGIQVAGAGASFPAPLYAKWAELQKAETGLRLNYQPIGSGGGVNQAKAGTVAFGATDKPLTAADLDAAGLVQFPTVIGGVAPVVNVPGVVPSQLKMTGSLLADIYLGRIKKWNDPALAALNPGLALPNLPISVIHRSDGSGTSFLFTSYLAAVAPQWASVGAGDALSWPVGQGGKGNDGLAAFVKQTPGSIGYVEYAYAKQNGMADVLLQNGSGAYVAATMASFTAAAAGADWSQAPGFHLLLINQPGAEAWPITGATFILMRRKAADPAQAKAVLGFFDWAYGKGDEAALALDYVPLPAAVKAQVRQSWSAIVGADGKPVYVPPAG